MLPRISNARRHLTFANVMSVIAVFIALGGASYAAVNLPKNSVGTKQLKGKSVGTKQLKGNAVNSNKVKDFSLRAQDFKEGQLPSGATGATGPQGTIGPTGAPGLSGLQRVTVQSSQNSDSPKVVSANCPTGKSAISASFDLSGGKLGISESRVVADSLNVLSSSASIEAYEVAGGTTGSWRVSLTVVCATVP